MRSLDCLVQTVITVTYESPGFASCKGRRNASPARHTRQTQANARERRWSIKQMSAKRSLLNGVDLPPRLRQLGTGAVCFMAQDDRKRLRVLLAVSIPLLLGPWSAPPPVTARIRPHTPCGLQLPRRHAPPGDYGLRPWSIAPPGGHLRDGAEGITGFNGSRVSSVSAGADDAAPEARFSSPGSLIRLRVSRRSDRRS